MYHNTFKMMGKNDNTASVSGLQPFISQPIFSAQNSPKKVTGEKRGLKKRHSKPKRPSERKDTSIKRSINQP